MNSRVFFFLLSWFWLGTLMPAEASPRRERTATNFETEFLSDPALLQEEPRVIPKASPTPPAPTTPQPTASPSEPAPTTDAQASAPPAPAVATQVRWREMEDADGRRLRVAVDGSQEVRTQTGVRPSDLPLDSGAIGARRSSRETAIAINAPAGGGLFVGTEIPYPTEYAPARVQGGWGSGYTVVPSTPTRFGSRETGVRVGPGGFQSTEFEGFINYGSPIRTLAPVFDAEGRPAGFQVIETPNRILQPVFRTIEIR
jgi:hypothetical protein